MSSVVNITGASFPSSGTVTAANSGLDRVSADGGSLAGFTYVTVTGDDIPPDAVVNGSGAYVIMRANQPTYPYTARFNISSEAADAAALTTGGIWYSCWIRASLLGALVTADHRDIFSVQNVSLTGGSRLRLDATLILDTELVTTDVNSDPGAETGLGWVIQNNATRPAGSTTAGLPQTFVNPTSTTFAQPVCRFGEWFKLTLYFQYHATEGRMSVYINDTLVLEAGKFDSTGTGDTIPSNWYDHDIELPYHEKIRWEVAGPFTMDNATGGGPTILPRHDLVPANSSITKSLFHNNWLGDPGDINGTHWAYTKPAGSPTIALTQYATGGIRPYTYRVVATSAANSDAVKVKSRDDIGTLPYRDKDGWATVAFQDIMRPTETTLNMSLRNADDDADLATFSIDTSGNLSVNGTDTGIDLATSIHWHVALHLNQSGGCRVTCYDLTTDTLDGVDWCKSAICDDWTPGEIGPLVFDIVYSASAGSGKVVNFGQVVVCETWEISVFDSLTEGNTDALSPAMAAPNHLTAAFGFQRNTNMVPGAKHARADQWDSIGQGRRAIACLAGRSGGRQKHWLDNALPGLEHTRGARLWFLDGGSVNDTLGFANVTSPATAASEAARQNADTASILAQWVHKQGNEAWITTMATRTALSGWDADMAAFVTARNAGLEALASQYQLGGRITFSDTTAENMTVADSVHPVPLESHDIVIEAIEQTATPGDQAGNPAGIGIGLGL